ncbi:unnamed protein product [Arabis nemorensis]|uniref:Uncharacterized protein n=1 Tax=Arabis nemorensis TaxID=586526 RepID=A0A565BG79_9BRAS|nr:unnamed protein product [Arabis nemorensis]
MVNFDIEVTDNRRRNHGRHNAGEAPIQERRSDPHRPEREVTPVKPGSAVRKPVRRNLFGEEGSSVSKDPSVLGVAAAPMLSWVRKTDATTGEEQRFGKRPAIREMNESPVGSPVRNLVRVGRRRTEEMSKNGETEPPEREETVNPEFARAPWFRDSLVEPTVLTTRVSGKMLMKRGDGQRLIGRQW